MTLTLLLAAPLALAAAKAISPKVDGNCQAPIWSTDGGKLAYEVNFHDKKSVELYVYTPGTDKPVRVKPPGGGGSATTAGFSGAGGESVAHELTWAPAKLGLFVYAGSNPARDYDLYTSQGSPLSPAPGADGNPHWSADGARIVFSSARSGQGDLYLIDIAQTDKPPRQLTSFPLSSELYPRLSPDGRSVVYVGRSAHGENLFVVPDVSAPSIQRLTDWPHVQTRPTWSPDGKKIAFYSTREDPKRVDLYVTQVGGTPTLVSRGVVMSARGPAWLPDSTGLVYVQDDDERYDPVYQVALATPAAPTLVATGTVGNTDLDLVKGTDGATWLAVAAQGLETDKVRDFRRIYVMKVK
jgi:Tol biopolymer transport system component